MVCKIIAGLNTDRAEKVMLGNEEIWQCFTLQVSHEILQQKREAVVEIGEPPFAIASSLCAGMQESGLGVVGAELGQLLRVFVLEFPKKVLQQFQTLLSLNKNKTKCGSIQNILYLIYFIEV